MLFSTLTMARTAERNGKAPVNSQLDESRQNTQALLGVIQKLMAAKSREEVLMSALMHICDQFGWAYGSFWQLDAGAQVLRFSLESGSVTPEFSQVTRSASFAKGVGLSGKTWQRMDLMFVEDLGEMVDCCRREPAQRAGVKSGICFPIVVNGEFQGTMDFFATETLTLSENRLDVLRNVGQLVSSSLERILDAEASRDVALNAEALSEVLGKLSTQSTTESAVTTALNTVKETFGWAYGSFWRLDEVAQVLRFSVETGSVTPEFTKVTREASFAKGVGLSGKTWLKNELVFVEDLGEMVDCCRREPAQRAGVKSGICFPIVVDGVFIGTMDFFATETLTLSADRLRILKNVGQLVSSTLERIKRSEAAQEVAQNAEALNQVLGTLASQTDQDEAIIAALSTVKQAFAWAYGSFWRLDEAAQVLRFKVETGSVTPEFTRVTREASFAKGVGLSGKTWQKMELMFVKDLGEMVDCCRREPAQRAGVKSGICFPIVVNGEMRGTMDFFATETLTLSEERLNVLRSVGRLVSSALERIEKAQADKEKAELLIVQAKSIANASETVSNHLQSVSSATEEMSTSVMEIAKNAASAADMSSTAVTLSEESQAHMNMLGKSVQEISKISDLIKSIAAQTNLLALNATIEAASAGEAGRGFTVVANEVKELAKQSTASTETIQKRIEEILRNTQETLASMGQITDLISQMNNINTTIAGAVEEQSAVTNEITKSVSDAAMNSSLVTEDVMKMAGIG
ncbi:MAG: GAF domain-containing protein [Candidatus Melainabacteria bacterium]